MRESKKRRLEKTGWRIGTAEEFLQLTPEEAAYVEVKIRLSQALREMAEVDPGFGHSVDGPTLAKANLVDQLFAPLQTQQRISDGLRDKLTQLRLPVFEALLETPEFLDEEDHPAREIVNGLMRLCFAERTSTKNLESTVSDIIEDLIHTENLETEQLEVLNNRLKALVERQDQSFAGWYLERSITFNSECGHQ